VKLVVGCLMLVALLAGIFAVYTSAYGLRTTALVFGIVFALLVWVVTAVHLISS
jgi:hypothetical protein